MDLRLGHPFWRLKTGRLADYPSLKQMNPAKWPSLTGVTEGLVAYHLVQKGVKTVLVDKRDVGAGSSAAQHGAAAVWN